MGANLNDPGYPTLLDAVQTGFAETGLTESQAAQHRRDWSYDDFYADRLNWKGWYDRGWIRMPDETGTKAILWKLHFMECPILRMKVMKP